MKECYLYEKLDNKQVQCAACNHRCKISAGKRGICGIRENKAGKLYLLTYAKACAEEIDPIEKKPLFHFMPGTPTLTIATVGCNFRCQWCQNWQISQASKDPQFDNYLDIIGFDLPPGKVVEDALKNNCPSISYSYTEPTVWMDYALDTMKIAKKEKLKNIWVSNGYMTQETINLISPYLDAINIDIKTMDKTKFQKYIGAKDPQFVLENCKAFKGKDIHLEITTLVVPTVNDSDEDLKNIAEFIAKVLGPEVPWHVSAYYPAFKMTVSATPIETLERAQKIGKKAGLKYVHLGNV